MRTKLLLMILVLAFCVGIASGVNAQAPMTFVYQGRLTDADGQPLTVSTTVEFAVVSSASGISVSYYDTAVAVTPDDNGVFTVELGPVPTTVFAGTKRWFSAVVGGTELLPRQPITSVPYAISTAKTPGVARAHYSGAFYSGGVSNTDYVIDSISITAPMAGYVEVSTMCSWINIGDSSSTSTELWLGASTSTAFTLDYGTAVVRIPANSATSGEWAFPMLSRQVFSVAAGTHKYYMVLNYNYGAKTSFTVGRPWMSAVFYPTAYGDVDYGTANGAPPVPGGAMVVSNPNAVNDQAITASQSTVDADERIRQLEEQVDRLQQIVEGNAKR